MDPAAVNMSINKVTLSWNDFESSASNTIRRLWLDQDFSDVTLVTEEERRFTAHKVVLITGSQLFRNLFTAAAHPSPLLFFRRREVGAAEVVVGVLVHRRVPAA